MGVEHLTAEDTTLWCAQAADAPLEIGGIAVCDGTPLRDDSGAVEIDAIRGHVAARLAASPRFRQVLSPVLLGQGWVWVDDEHFDIKRHVRLVALPPPGGDAELREFLVRVLEAPLPAGRPLWELWIVDGLADGRVALVPKVSHIVGDGMAVLSAVLSIFDLEPVAGERDTSASVSGPPPGPVALLGGALWQRWSNRAGGVRRLVGAGVGPRALVGEASGALRAAATILRVAPSLPITRPVGPRRDFAWVGLPLPALMAVKRSEGVKLNDVVLEVTTAGVRRYLAGLGTHADRLRVVVPVSTHGQNLIGELENRFSMLFVDLPGMADPLERLRTIHAETERGKASRQVNLGEVVLATGGLLPQRLLRSLVPRLLHHQPFVNVVVTNLPGPRVPLYLLGSRLAEMFPFVTVTANLGVMIGVVSYLDTLGVGITVDSDLVPDVAVLADAVREASADLVRAAGGAGTADPAVAAGVEA